MPTKKYTLNIPQVSSETLRIAAKAAKNAVPVLLRKQMYEEAMRLAEKAKRYERDADKQDLQRLGS